MVAQGDEQIKEERRAAVVHLQLHGPAALERASRADDECQIMCPQLGVILGRVGVRISRRRQDRAALDARFCFRQNGSSTVT